MDNPKYSKYANKLETLKQLIAEEIEDECNWIIDLIKKYCVNRSGNSVETECFFLKMAGDYKRYLWEIGVPPLQTQYKTAAKMYYSDADKLAEKLPACCPTRLGHVMNYSVFLRDVMHD